MCGARPSHGEEADLAGERVRLILNRLADLARNRSRAYDSEGQSEMGGERGCNRAGHFHCRAVWHRRVTPKSIQQPQLPFGARSTEFRNETRRECLNHFVILSARHLRKTLAKYFYYYHRSRPHVVSAWQAMSYSSAGSHHW